MSLSKHASKLQTQDRGGVLVRIVCLATAGRPQIAELKQDEGNRTRLCRLH